MILTMLFLFDFPADIPKNPARKAWKRKTHLSENNQLEIHVYKRKENTDMRPLIFFSAVQITFKKNPAKS